MHADQSLPLQLQAVSRSYHGRMALRELSLTVPAGQILALLGPNGAGKTTALALLAGLQQPDQGRVTLWGESPERMAVRQRMGVMLQSAVLPGSLTVAELVELTGSYYPQSLGMERVIRLAGLEKIWTRRYQALSGGQQRAVQFAQAICGRPGLLLLDEPSVGLDIVARNQMWAAVQQLASEGCAVLLTTHHLEEAEALATRIAVLRRGELVADGSLHELQGRIQRVQIRCRTVLQPGQVTAWPGVVACRRHDSGLQIQASHAEAVVAALLASDPGLDQLDVRRPGLAEVFGEVLGDPAGSSIAEAA